MRREKVSGRWGFRPLGRGDGGKRNLKLSKLPVIMLRSRAAQRHTGAVDCPGSRDQLPITVAILLNGSVRVDSSVVP